jgi:hypothetical protein
MRWLLDQDRWEHVIKLHVSVLTLLLTAICSAAFALVASPTRWLGIASLLLAAAGGCQTRIADDFLDQEERFWDKSKYPDGPPTTWMHGEVTNESISWGGRARRQLFQNPNIGIVVIGVSTALGVLALFT